MFKRVINSSYDWHGLCPNFGIVNLILCRGGVFLTLYLEVQFGNNCVRKTVNVGYVLDSMLFFVFTYR